MKILIVDDSATDRKLLRYICERHGYKDIVEAKDGQEGLERALQEKPGLIISDALMPRMDGFHFLRALKTHEALSAIPFVFYSATYTGENEAELAKSLGAEAFITKPIEPEEFWRKLSAILEASRSQEMKARTAVAMDTEPEYLKEYSRIVAAKLEEKVRELEESKAKIEASEKFNRNILESINEGLIVIDRSYRIVSANRGFARQADMLVADIVGNACYRCSHHRTRPCFENNEDCPVRHTFETGEPWTGVHTHYDKAGNPLVIETKSFPLEFESGKVSLAIELCIDITEKKKLEDQLRQAQKMEAIGQLAGGVAHDFNNILTAIIGYGSILQKKMKGDDPLRLNVDQIMESANRAARLTHSLLAFSRKQIINPQPIDLVETIQRVEKFLRRIIGEDIELKSVAKQKSVIVNADNGQLEQVLMNLATNARDAMPQGGTFTIATDLLTIDEEFIKAHGFGEPGVYACMSVSDTGIGMDEATRKHMFEPFFTTKEVGRGTGLGLSIVYGIIQQHHGHVNVYSEPGRGTNFTIYLPIAPSTMEERGLQESSTPLGGTETVLLAEDDETVRALFCAILAEFGYTVIAAQDGQEAVDKFRENRDRIRLVVLDMIMPRKTGTEAYEEIKGMQPEVKALFVSGYTSDAVHIRQVLAEGLEVLQKPIAPTDFIKKIRLLLDT